MAHKQPGQHGQGDRRRNRTRQPVRLGTPQGRGDGRADLLLLRDSLTEAVRGLGGQRAVIVHGQCPPRHPQTRRAIPWEAAERLPGDDQTLLLGADWLADRLAGIRGIWAERHPADWDAHGKAAGFRRNAEMVALGADTCLFFAMPCTDSRCARPRPHDSHGASHCAGLAAKAGIPVRRFPT